MAPERTELFKIDPRTVELDSGTSQPVAKGIDGKTHYRFWGLVSRTLYQANVDYLKGGLLDLGVTMEEVKRDFLKYRTRESLHGPELELGVAAVFSAESERGFNFLHRDLGIWVEVPEEGKFTREDTRRVIIDNLDDLLSGKFEAELLK